jgi:hypothetical protein
MVFGKMKQVRVKNMRVGSVDEAFMHALDTRTHCEVSVWAYSARKALSLSLSLNT